MATFPRTVTPENISSLWIPTGLKSKAHAGVVQVRAITSAGWMWEETWDTLDLRDADVQGFLGWLDYAWNRLVLFDVKHLLTPGSGLPANGAGGGTPVVNGASQTGTSLDTDGWPVSTTGVMKAGDVFTIAGDKTVYRVHTDADSDAGGAATINFIPALRSSPADGAALTTEDVVFQAVLWERPTRTSIRQPHYLGNYTLRFVEALE